MLEWQQSFGDDFISSVMNLFELFCFVELTQIEVVLFQPMNFNKLFQMVIKNVSKGYNEQQLPSSK